MQEKKSNRNEKSQDYHLRRQQEEGLSKDGLQLTNQT